MAKLLDALKRNRHGDRDRLIGLLIFRHGLRVSEACDLRCGMTSTYQNAPLSSAGLRAAPIAAITWRRTNIGR